MICRQCQDAPCLNACPTGAISVNATLGRVEINEETCIGCRTCVSVCPFGVMTFNSIDRKVIKCDLCDGDPQCVRFCDVHAIEYVDACDAQGPVMKAAAQKMVAAMQVPD